MAGRSNRRAEPASARPPVHVLGADASDERLWIRTTITEDGLSLGPGILVEEPAGPPPVIVVPDLCRASPATIRAAVTTIGADQASAERISMSYHWRPRARWLASADGEEARALSPHLLDRFPVRVTAAGLTAPWLRDEAAAADWPPDTFRPDAWLPRLPWPARDLVPALSGAAADRLLSVVPPGPSRRRDLAVCLVARALAARDQAGEITPAHVDDAVTLLGITASAAVSPPLPDVPAPQPLPGQQPPATPDGGTPGQAGSGASSMIEPSPDVTMKPGQLPPPEALTEEPDRWPYPEDDPDALARHDSLLDPGSGRPVATRRVRGRPIGTRHTAELHDIAIVATVLHASMFRRARGTAPGSPLVIRPTDLREYRRSPSPSAALVLVLDHSCWAGWDKNAAIGRYLYWAYRDNAAVSVVEFGHRDAGQELRAVSYRAESLLDPRVTESLDRPPGLASPLAHALDLAVQEVRRQLRGMPRERVILLVATDGRGNVPLSASLLNRLPAENVGSTGVRDALTAAAAVSGISGVETIVIAPGVTQYAALPFDLADAMNGQVIVAERACGQQEAQA